MGEDVGLDAAAVVEVLAADGAGEHDVGGVEDLVHVEAARLAETLATVRALERLILGVDIFVVSQMILAPKRFATYITGEGSLVRVCSLVYHQIVGFGKLTVTELADEPLLGAGGTGEQGAQGVGGVQPVAEQEGVVQVGQDGGGAG